jgi:hypothetical protein
LLSFIEFIFFCYPSWVDSLDRRVEIILFQSTIG